MKRISCMVVHGGLKEDQHSFLSVMRPVLVRYPESFLEDFLGPQADPD